MAAKISTRDVYSNPDVYQLLEGSSQQSYHTFFDEKEIKESKEFSQKITKIENTFRIGTPLLSSDLDILKKRYVTKIAMNFLTRITYRTAEPIGRIVIEYLNDDELNSDQAEVPSDCATLLSCCTFGFLNCCFNLDGHRKHLIDSAEILKIRDVIKMPSFDGSCESIMKLARESDTDALIYVYSMSQFDYFTDTLDWYGNDTCYNFIPLSKNLIDCFSNSRFSSEKIRTAILTAVLDCYPIKDFSTQPYIVDRKSALLCWHFERAVEHDESNILMIFLKSGIPVSNFSMNFERTIDIPAKKIKWKQYSKQLTKQHAIFHPSASRETIRFWLDSGLSPDIKFEVNSEPEKTKHSITLLFFAILEKNQKIIDLLLSYNADVYAPCIIAGEQTTPHKFAIEVGKPLKEFR